MSLSQEDELVLDAIIKLARAGQGTTARGEHAAVEQNIRTFLSVQLRTATVERLERFQKRARCGEVNIDDFDVVCGPIVLPPELDNSGYLPVARLVFDSQNAAADVAATMRLYLAFFLFEEFTDERPQCIGVRFESPEGLGGGHHDYYHAQFIRAFGREPAFPLSWAQFVTVSQPAFPLPASCRVTLLLSTILATYGLKYFNSDVWSVLQGNNVLKHRIQEWIPTITQIGTEG